MARGYYGYDDAGSWRNDAGDDWRWPRPSDGGDDKDVNNEIDSGCGGLLICSEDETAMKIQQYMQKR